MTKKKNHYLSKFYIEGFCDQDGFVWSYPKNNPGKPFSAKPENTAFQNNLYHLDLDELDKNIKIDAIEDYLANSIETPAANSFKELRNKIFPNDIDRKILSKFFGFLFVRTPRQIAHLKGSFDEELSQYSILLASNKDHYHESWKKFDPASTYTEIEDSRKSILNGEIKCESHPNFVLDKMLLSGSIIGELLSNMHWGIIETQDTLPFLTSDSLINVYHPDIPPNKFHQPGFGMPNVRIVIPISKNLALLMVNNKDYKNNSIITIGNKEVKEINKRIYSLSNKFVFASSDSDELKSFLNICFNELFNNDPNNMK